MFLAAEVFFFRGSSLMEESSQPPQCSTKRSRFFWRVIADAIESQSCPICLRVLDCRRAVVLRVCKHAYCSNCILRWSNLKRTCPLCNATFDSWFFDIDLYSRRLFTKRLAPLPEAGSKSNDRQPPSRAIGRRRNIELAREEYLARSSRTRPLPWRRSFGRLGSVPSDVIAERKLQWRASIYNRGLQAIPVSPMISAQQNKSKYEKEKVLQRIEPWMRRELVAILGDPDPSIIVHVAASIFIPSLEGRSNVASGDCGVENDFLALLRPFLQDKTDLFWHELRCFADTSLTMETYDAVVQY